MTSPSALDLFAGNLDQATLDAVDMYRKAAKVIDASHIALGRKATFKTVSMSALDAKIDLHATATTTTK